MALNIPPASEPKSQKDNYWDSLGDNYKVSVTESGTLINTEWVGTEDTTDYRLLNLFAPGFYTFYTSGVTSSIKFTLYRYTGSSGLKKVTGFSLSSGSKNSKNLLLDAGTYYVCYESKSSKKSVGTWYSTDIVADTFTRINTADDDYTNLSPSYTVQLRNTGTVINNDWVGFGDSIDFRRLDLDVPGSYSFSLSGLTAKAKLTIYTVDSKGKLKKLTSVSGKAEKVSFTKEKLMNSGTYYLSVEATGWKKGQNTAYSVTATGQAFTQGNTLDDVWNTLSDAYCVTLLESGTIISNEWVGFGDTVDWRRINLTESGRFSFYIDNVSEKVKMTVYSMDPVKQKLKKLSSVSVSKGYKEFKKPLELIAGTYYISVEASNAKKGKNSSYDVGVNATFNTPPQNPGLPSFIATEINPADGGIRNAIISYETQERNYTFSVADGQTGNYGFIFTSESPGAQMILYKYDQEDRSYDIHHMFAPNDALTLSLDRGDYLIELSSISELSKHQEFSSSVLISTPYLASASDLARSGMTDTQRNLMTLA